MTMTGQLLAVGQRLVTRDGQLRRWDGFVSTGAGAAAAERLIRANRLAELARELPALEARVAQAETERDAAVRQVEQFRAAARRRALAATQAERDGARGGAGRRQRGRRDRAAGRRSAPRFAERLG